MRRRRRIQKGPQSCTNFMEVVGMGVCFYRLKPFFWVKTPIVYWSSKVQFNASFDFLELDSNSVIFYNIIDIFSNFF